MPFYAPINNATPQGRRTAERLLALRAQLTAEIPARAVSGNLLIATWNIREFESPAYGQRGEEPLYYIAEIISRFDLVAVQEVREDLSSIERVRQILGSWWKLLVTDVTEGGPGNKERSAFIYDSRKVAFGGLAGELVLPPTPRKSVKQPARSPFICGFQAGWFRFSLCTTHSIYGKGGRNSPERVKEIAAVAGFLAERAAKKTADRWSRSVILLGDFNIFSVKDKTLAALTGAGFDVPTATLESGSNAKRDKAFDQIAFKTSTGGFQLTGKAGVFDYYKTVYRPDDEAAYAREMGAKYAGKAAAKRAAYYLTYWRTFQMSDHLPLWAELNTDFSDFYLEKKTRKPVAGRRSPRA
jgi:endonuclease/exonuclease/phosphatase family metal-dependent hydrolase